MPESIERFLHNLVSALGLCAIEDVEVTEIVIPALICVGILWLVGQVVYEFVLDPQVITAATLDSLSINPDNWIPR